MFLAAEFEKAKAKGNLSNSNMPMNRRLPFWTLGGLEFEKRFQVSNLEVVSMIIRVNLFEVTSVAFPNMTKCSHK